MTSGGPGPRSAMREALRPEFHPYPRPNQRRTPFGSQPSSSHTPPHQYDAHDARTAYTSHPQRANASQAQVSASSAAQHSRPMSMSASTSRSSTSGTSKPQYDSRATIVIIGMKGAGKTTLGLIANRTLGRTFIDTDHLFRTSENVSLESFVAAHGWNAFRQRETAILKDLLTRYPHDTVIACGGGIIESPEARRVLQAARSSFPVIQVLREEDAILRYVEGRWLRQYDEELETMIKRRASLYRQCCSHTFFNLTMTSDRSSAKNGTRIHPLKFKQVGESFMRLLQCILGDVRKNASRLQLSTTNVYPTRNSISHLLGSHGPGPDAAEDRRMSANLSPLIKSTPGSHSALPMRANVLDRSSVLTRRTTAMSLTFPDLSRVDPDLIRKITQGVDALEVRIDMLDCMKPASAEARSERPEREPLIEYEEVARQIETLRRLVPDLPILFTLRSDREGGFFYDDRKLAQRDTASPHSQAIYFFLLEMAIGMGIELLDVELGWDPWMTKRLVESRGRTRIVPSYHDLMGALKWDSNVPSQLYERACSFGSGVHIVMMIGTTSRASIEQNTYISAFSARMLSAAAADPRRRLPPLMALNMGIAGRSSRPFNNVLNFVSHPAMPIKAGRGQFSLKEMMETLVRLSLIQKSHFHLFGALDGEASLTKTAIQAAFDEFGLPYKLLSEERWTLNEYVAVHQREDVPQRDDEIAESEGAFIVGQAHRQVDLYHIVHSRTPHRLSQLARVVQAVDVMAREDMALSLLGTERGRRAPSSLGEMRGPLVGCHSLPAALYRVLSAHLAPINAPNVHRSGLVVILDDVEKEEDSQASTIIAKRAAVFALAKIGFGTVYVVDELSHHSKSRESQSRRASVTPSGSRDTSLPPLDLQDGWSNEVLQLAQQYSTDVLNGQTEAVADVETAEEAVPHVRCSVKHIGLRSLSYPSAHAHAATTEQARSEAADATSNVGRIDSDEDPETAATMQEFERHPSKRPCAIIIVGGTQSQQNSVMRLLWDSNDDVTESSTASAAASLPVTSASDAISASHADVPVPFVLPKEVWDSSFGGTIIGVPSTRTESMGKRPQRTRRTATEGEDATQKAYPGAEWERGGWINVAPWVLDRDRVQRTLIEAWTRRSAPKQHLRHVWEGEASHEQ